MNEEYKRNLSHVEKIIDIQPIPGADQIEVCTLLGWQCVIAKKENFKVGDLVVYVEIDSICPEKPEFEFLRDRKFRVKTIKLRKTLSQGLVLPITILPPITATNPYSWAHWKEGTDVTDILGITHFDKESSLHKPEHKSQNKILKFLLNYSLGRKIILPFIRKEKGAWPEFLEHTDEPRLANIPRTLEKYNMNGFYVGEKLDGQSFGCFYRKQKVNFLKKDLFGVVSRNIWLKTPDESVYWKMARKYDLENVLRRHYKVTGQELCINGEQCGPGIQKNKYELKEHDLFIFNIINNRTKYHFNLEEMTRFCEKNNLKIVPILDKNFKQLNSVNEMEVYSRGKSVLNPKTEREGIVCRLIVSGEKVVSYKQISSTFLLKNDE